MVDTTIKRAASGESDDEQAKLINEKTVDSIIANKKKIFVIAIAGQISRLIIGIWIIKAMFMIAIKIRNKKRKVYGGHNGT